MTRADRARRRRALTASGLGLGAVVAALSLLFALVTASPEAATPHRVRSTVERTATRRPPIAHTPAAPLHIRARVLIDARAPMQPIPSSFLGISTEYWALPLWAHHLSLLDRVLALVRGPGPLVLRIGGDSADRTFWSPVHEMPEWAFEVTPAWLREVRTIIRHTGARLILDLNLATATPMIAVRWARVAEAMLPKHSIIGFEIGNEPDLYGTPLWQEVTIDGREIRLAPAQITKSSYAEAFAAYSRALSSVAPGVPLLGPAISEPRVNLDWVSQLLASPHPGLKAVTVHRYPYSACVPSTSPMYPTISRVLSEAATAGVARSVEGAVQAAHRAGLPLRLSELNSVTCGGVNGVSNTMATALWAPDALFELMHAGVSSASVHVRAHAYNAAFSLRRRGLVAHPLLYGMVMFNRMLGSDPRLVSLRLRARQGLHLKAWAVRSGRRTLRVLLINKGHRSAGVGLTLPAQGSATVQRLLAPSVRARRGVTLAGQHLGANGQWQGRLALGAISPQRHEYALSVPRYSAALVTVRLRPGALSARRRALSVPRPG
jgi:hypothetical protein